MKYIRTEDKIITDSIATHKLIRDICDAGYFKTLKKGANVRISKEWFNYYGSWVDIIDEEGLHYSIRPNEVETVVKELHQADTIEELCDEFVIDCKSNIKHKPFVYTLPKDIKEYYNSLEMTKDDTIVYGAIWVEGNEGESILKPVAKMNDDGDLELL